MNHRLISGWALILIAGSLHILASAAPTSPPSPSPAPSPQATPTYSGLVSGGDSAHPVKLNIPYIWVGDLHLPSQEEMKARFQLEALAALTDEEVRDRLLKWDKFNQMGLGDQGRMFSKVQDFRDKFNKLAQDEANHLGLTTLPPADALEFKKDFLEKRWKADESLVNEFQAKFEVSQKQLDEELLKKFKPLVPTPTPQNTASTPVASSPSAKPIAPVSPSPTATKLALNSPVPTPAPTPKK